MKIAKISIKYDIRILINESDYMIIGYERYFILTNGATGAFTSEDETYIYEAKGEIETLLKTSDKLNKIKPSLLPLNIEWAETFCFPK